VLNQAETGAIYGFPARAEIYEASPCSTVTFAPGVGALLLPLFGQAYR
jgi:hypothetical protein